MNTFGRLLGVGAVALLFSVGASADTLELKDGRILDGKYLGGTQVILRFEINGDVQTFRVSQVQTVRFDRHHRYDPQDNGAPPPPNDQSGPDSAPPPPQNGPDAGPPPDQGPGGPLPQDQSRPDDNPPPDQSRRGDYPPPGPPDSDQYGDRDSRHDYVYAAPGTAITIPAGQPMLVRMIDPVDSRHNQVGDVFRATLETNLVVNNVLVARRGSDVFGRLAYTKEAKGLSGSSELELDLTRIIIDGREFPLVSGAYTVKGRGRGGETAAKVGGGAIVGAIIGGIAGGGTGAAIGAGVGGAAGAGAEVLTRGRAVRVPSETLLEFRLDQSVTVTPTQK